MRTKFFLANGNSGYIQLTALEVIGGTTGCSHRRHSHRQLKEDNTVTVNTRQGLPLDRVLRSYLL